MRQKLRTAARHGGYSAAGVLLGVCVAGIALAVWTAPVGAADTNPAPTLTSLSPAAAALGSSTLTLTVDGAGFVLDSRVLWNDAPCPTTFVSASRVTALVDAVLLASPQTALVTVANPAPGGGVSGSLPFVVALPNPVPEVTGVSPEQVLVGSGPVGITVLGNGFVPGATVYWNGEDRATGYIAPTMLTATVRAGDVAVPGLAVITVANPAPGGGLSLTSQTCAIVSPVPAISTLAPVACWAGSEGFTLTVRGAGFMPASRIHWAGVERDTVFVSPEELRTRVSAADVRFASSVSVRVFTPAPGGGLSDSAFFAVQADETPPVTRAVGLGGTWHNSPVTFRLAATDVGLGVAWTFFRVGTSGPFRTGTKVSVPAPATHANDGLHTVSYYSVDQVLNWETRQTVRVGIDTRPPVTVVDDARVKRGGALRPRFRVSDALSDRARDARLLIVDRAGKVQVRRDLGHPRTGVWQTGAAVTITLPRGAYRLKVLAHDLAGNAQGKITVGELSVT